MLSCCVSYRVGLPKLLIHTRNSEGYHPIALQRTGAEIKAPSMHLGISLRSPALSDALSTVVPFMQAMRTTSSLFISIHGMEDIAGGASNQRMLLLSPCRGRKATGAVSNSRATLPLFCSGRKGQIHKQCVVFSDGEVMHHHSYR